jgi:hypothetical protein
VSAEEAAAAGNRKRHDHTISRFQIRDAATYFFDDAHELVAEDIAAFIVGMNPSKR